MFLLLTGWLYAILYPSAFHLLLCLFFLVCGICTAAILRQARHILLTIQDGKPFQRENARSMGKAAVCCWIISGAALVRLVLDLIRLGNPAPFLPITPFSSPPSSWPGSSFR